MNIRSIALFALAVLLASPLQAHSGKPRHHVVIDTDGALDDMRALSMLLAGNEIRVLAITCSPGTLPAERTAQKVRSLLSDFHHEGIPVGITTHTNHAPPPWSNVAAGFGWGRNEGYPGKPALPLSSGLLEKTTAGYDDSLTLVALGSLKTYADWFKDHPDAVNRVKKILWYNDHTVEEGFNYQASPESYRQIAGSGIPLEIIFNDNPELRWDERYLEHLAGVKSRYGRQIHRLFSEAGLKEQVRSRKLWDDLAGLYLAVPILFNREGEGNLTRIALNPMIPRDFIYETIATLLESSVTTNNRVFREFPTDKRLYKEAYAAILDTTLTRYGPEEWKAVSLTNEIHGHTGIYSIIGAKMGIRAMEYFNVGVNNMTVRSYAGSDPPLSCLNDGVQISTGSTPGQGLLAISDTTLTQPTVIFTFNGRSAKVTLDQAIADRLREDIRYGVEEFGLLTDTYWRYIEELGIDYWARLDRNRIFRIEEL